MRFGRPKVKVLLRKQERRRTKRRVGTGTWRCIDHGCDRGMGKRREGKGGRLGIGFASTGIEEGAPPTPSPRQAPALPCLGFELGMNCTSRPVSGLELWT